VSPYRKAIIVVLIVLGCVVLIPVVLTFTVPIITDRLGSSEALAADDNTKEIMATSITDAQELWSTARDRKENRTADGDKIAIAIIASKLFELRYLQTYIK